MMQSPMNVTTIGGSIATLQSVGPDGKIYGHVEGFLTATWWDSDGRHNLYRDLDLSKDDVAAAGSGHNAAIWNANVLHAMSTPALANAAIKERKGK